MIRIDGSLQTPSTYTKQPGVKIRNLWAALLAGSLILGNHAQAQTNINYNDFTAFKSPGKNWKTASKAIADLNRDNLFKIEKGTGILVNVPGKNKGTDLYTADEFGDLDLEMDYMVAKNAKSGIFLQDNYLVSLSDSWKITTPLASDNGGIYERWDEGRGKGNEAYEGHPARQNVSRAPGLWQHIKIIFKAPRFNSSGKKIENAKILQLELNGVTVQENLELSGPSRGAPGNEETAMGPIRILGENGAIAFKNLVIKKYKGEPPTLSDLKYVLYYGKYETVPDFTKLPPPAEQGDLHILNSSFVKRDVEFLVRYTGNVHIYHEDDYVFQRETYGNGTVKINNTMVGDLDNYTSTPIHLTPGTYPLEMIYTKALGWLPTSFGLTISSPDTRAFLISDETSLYRETPDPIVIGTPGNTILRSFMDIPEGKRIIHNVNVGSPQQLHYSYDMDNGAVFQLWRGKFIDAIPMWFSRGDGSSKPVGSRLQLGIPKPSIVKLLSLNDSIPADTSGSSFVTRGYELDNKNNQTIFVYDAHGTAVRDALQVTGNGGELKRTVSLEKNVGNLFIRIAEGEKIEHLSKGWYLVDDAKYYIHIDDGSPAPSVRQSGNKSVLVAPVQNSFSYSILF